VCVEFSGKISFAEFSQLMESADQHAAPVELDNVVQTIEVTDIITEMPEEHAQEEEEPEESTSQSEDTESTSPKKKSRMLNSASGLSSYLISGVAQWLFPCVEVFKHKAHLFHG
jgi:hypothetical protein